MESTKDTKFGGVPSMFSRRNLLKGATALTAAASVPEAFGQRPTGARPGTVWLYIGTYTVNLVQPPVQVPGPRGRNGKGIYLCSLDLHSGELTVEKLVAPAVPVAGTVQGTSSPSTIALDPTRTHLYAGNEYGPPGAVSAYSINRQTGDLTLLNAVPTQGAPAHVSVDQKGKYLFSAEYSGSWFEVYEILGNGSIGNRVSQFQTLGNVDMSFTTKPATSAPPGSFAFSAHEGPNGHPHQMETDPSNEWVIGSDAGQDRIYIWKLTQGATDPLTPAAIPFVGPPNDVPPGDGPRHFAFHPNGNWMYSIQEEGSTIIFWRFNRSTGRLTKEQQVSSLPPGFGGTNFTSEIRVSDDGDFVYGTNRLNDTVTVFKVGHDGRLSQTDSESTLGDYPRIITLDPTGRFMAVGNQFADNVTTFSVNRGNGSLKFTGNYTPLGAPSGMVFLI
jgi:6-phosphogluconolactonase (cycloisomerase 2 family)